MNTFKPQLESLGDRIVPAVITTRPDTNGTITIVGNDSSETIRVTTSATQVICNGTAVSARGVTGIVIDAKGGNDWVDASGVHLPTIIRGGSGDDVIFGGSNSDKIYGDTNNDRLFGMGGYDYLTGGTGRDFLDDGNRSGHEWYADESQDGWVDFVADVVVPYGGAKPSHVSQGQSNTCVFLAALGSMAQSGISPSDYIAYLGYNSHGVGVYNVKLKVGTAWRNFTVEFSGATSSLDAEATVDTASWTIIMHRAWLQMHGNSGAQAYEGLAALGLNTATSYLNGANDFATLANWLARGGAAVAITKGGVSTAKLTTTHAYQVVQAGYVNGVAMVQVRNPWGIDISRTYTYDGVNDGYFWLTWKQFTDNFGTLAYGGR